MGRDDQAERLIGCQPQAWPWEMKTDTQFAIAAELNLAFVESEQRYQRLLAATTDYVYSVQMQNGKSGETVHGPGCEAVTGYTSAEFRADPYLWYRVIHEEDRSAVLAQVDWLLKGEQPPPIEHRIIHKNGSTRWIRNTPLPHRSGSGRLLSYDGLISDITHRKAAELALKETTDRLWLVIQGSNDGIWDWNLITNEVYFSPRWKEMLGYGADEVENTFTAWDRLIHAEDRDRAWNELQAYFSGRKPTYELEHRLRHKDGTYRWILARGVVLRDNHGKPVRMAGSHVDLTERIQAAKRLEQANDSLAKRGKILKRIVQRLRSSNRELKETQWQLIEAAKFESAGILAAGVAHEVKNPLQTILMGLDHLATQLPTDDEALAVTMRDMRQAIRRATTIIRELLSLSAAANFQLQEIDLNALLESSLRLVQSELVTSKTKVVRQLCDDLPQLACDRAKIEQVLINLFINAIQAMPKGGTLRVSSRTFMGGDETEAQREVASKFKPTDRLVALGIQDTGTGIAAEHLGRVFDPFFTTKPVGVGTGLGLTVSRRIVELHGGALTIQNAATGGALATIFLKQRRKEQL